MYLYHVEKMTVSLKNEKVTFTPKIAAALLKIRQGKM